MPASPRQATARRIPFAPSRGRRIRPPARRAHPGERFAAGPREPHARPVRRDDRGQPPVGAGLQRRLATGLRDDPPDVRRVGRGLAGHVQRPGGELGVQGAAEQCVGRELRPSRRRNGPNIPLTLGAQTSVKFYYDHETHWVTDNVGSVIAVAPGSFQSELGCPGDWQPDCLRSWLEDVDGDGTYSFETTAIPAGDYETKVALNESWNVNYGAGGVQDGPNIPFTVPAAGSTTTFSYDSTSHVLTVSSVGPAATPTTTTSSGTASATIRATRSIGRPVAQFRPEPASSCGSGPSTTTLRASAPGSSASGPAAPRSCP